MLVLRDGGVFDFLKRDRDLRREPDERELLLLLVSV
jgi:hypothetical protein